MKLLVVDTQKLITNNMLYNFETFKEHLVSWEPTEKQWWITGINPSTVGKADVKSRF